MNILSSLLKFIGEGGLWSLTYPVGSYYETSDTNFDPNTAWGGTWALDSQGRVTVCAGTNASVTYQLGATGGSKDAIVPTHYHGVAAIGIGASGAHVHNVYQRNSGTGGTRATNNVTYGASGHDYTTDNAFVSSGAHSHTVPAHNTGNTGTSGTNANMQPYIVVNRWHRTA